MPRFHYKSAVSNPQLAEDLIKVLMSQKLTDITVAQVLAVSPDVRNHLINYLCTHKVEVHHLEHLEEQDHQKVIVAKDSIKLRKIEVLINEDIPIKAMIDSGSQIITLRKDIWRDLGKTLDLTSRLTLEGADKSTSHTIGLV